MPSQQPVRIHVCGLRHVPETIVRTGARHLVSVIDAEFLPHTPSAIRRDRHLKLDMHDITEAQPGMVLPASQHVAKLLDFVESWDGQTPILMHCFAGISRSTAAAFVALCALSPHLHEDSIARALRQSSDTAVPNRLFVSLADDVLRRDGRMVAALNRMAPHRVAMECVPFAIEARKPNSTG